MTDSMPSNFNVQGKSILFTDVHEYRLWITVLPHSEDFGRGFLKQKKVYFNMCSDGDRNIKFVLCERSVDISQSTERASCM